MEGLQILAGFGPVRTTSFLDLIGRHSIALSSKKLSFLSVVERGSFRSNVNAEIGFGLVRST